MISSEYGVSSAARSIFPSAIFHGEHYGADANCNNVAIQLTTHRDPRLRDQQSRKTPFYRFSEIARPYHSDEESLVYSAGI